MEQHSSMASAEPRFRIQSDGPAFAAAWVFLGVVNMSIKRLMRVDGVPQKNSIIYAS